MAIRRYQVISASGIVIEDAANAIFYPANSIFNASDQNASVQHGLAIRALADITDAQIYPPVSGLPPSGPAGGDLVGFYPNPTIAQKGAIVGSVLRWDGDSWEPATGIPPTGAAGGDLAGTYPSPTIAQKGAVVGNYLRWDGLAWNPAAFPVGFPPTGAAGGDLAGTYPNPTIAQKGAVSGQVLIWNGTSWQPGAPAPGGAAGGQLTGTYPNPTIAQGGATPGQVLGWNGAAWVPTSTGASSLTGVLSVGNTTGAFDIIISAGQKIYSAAASALVLDGTTTLNLQTGSTTRWQIQNSGHLFAAADNSYDIGSSTLADRPRNIYARTSFVVGASVTISTDTVAANGALNLTTASSNFVSVIRDTARSVRINTGGPVGHGGALTISRPSDGAFNTLIGVGLAPNEPTIFAGTSTGAELRFCTPSSAGAGSAWYDVADSSTEWASSPPTTNRAMMLRTGSGGGGSSNLGLRSGGQFLFSGSGTDAGAAGDTGLARIAAGFAKISDGSAGFGSLRIFDGTAAAPSLSFAGATTAGFFNASGNLGFATGGLERGRFTGDGAQQWEGLASAPALSAVNNGRIYFDTTLNKFQASEDGGAYADLVTPSSTPALSAVLAVGNTTGAFNIIVSSGQKLVSAAASALTLDGTTLIDLQTGAVSRWQINASGHIVPQTDNSLDIGITATNRIRTLYAGTSVVVGSSVTIGTAAVTGSGALTVTATAATLSLVATGSNAILLTVAATDRAAVRGDQIFAMGDTPTASQPVTRELLDATNTTLLASKDGANQAITRLYTFSSSGALYAPALTFHRGRGTAASPTAVSQNDLFGSFSWSGQPDGSSFTREGARIDGYVDGSTISTTSMPGRLVFSTTPSGSVTPVERWRINNLGTVFFGAGDLATTGLNGAGNAVIPIIAYRNDGSLIDCINSSATATSGAEFRGIRTRGTNASPTATLSGDILVRFEGVGFYTDSGSGNAGVAEMRMEADGNTLAASSPGRIVFTTVPSGSNTLTERWRIDNGGTITVGDASVNPPPINTAFYLPRSGVFEYVRLRNADTDPNGGQTIVFQRSRGTVAVPATTIANDQLGALAGQQFLDGGTGYATAATITFNNDGTPSSSSGPGSLRFLTTPTGATGSIERARINNAGTIFAGNGETSATPNAGIISATGGSGAVAGAALTVRSGAGGSSLASGALTLTTGTTTDGNTGVTTLATASPTGTNRASGDINISTGTPTGIGTAGSINLTAADSPTGTDGAIKFTTLSAERMAVRSDGVTMIGEQSSTFDLSGLGLTYANTTFASVRDGETNNFRGFSYVTDTTSAFTIQGVRANGSAGSPTAVVAGDRLLTLLGAGQFSTTPGDFLTMSAITLECDGTVGSGDTPGRIVFRTVPDGSGTLTERWRIDNAGHFFPGTDNALDIGVTGTNRIRTLYAGTSVVVGSTVTIGTAAVTGSGALTVTATAAALTLAATGANVVAVHTNGAVRTSTADTTLTSSVNIVPNAAGTLDLGVASTGWKRLYLDSAIDTTTGDAATINKAAGRFRKDTTGATFTLTNSYITANSIVLLTFVDVDATATTMGVVAAAGSATITFNAAPTANLNVNFLVINAD